MVSPDPWFPIFAKAAPQDLRAKPGSEQRGSLTNDYDTNG
jgi:hypothetical protein